MNYQIIPLELGSLVDRNIFRQSNKEIKCGTVWKLGSVLTKIKPAFIKTYDPNIGICIKDIPGGGISKADDGEKVIYFSDTVGEDEQDELTDIFYQTNHKHPKNFVDVFLDMGWTQMASEAYLFGELEIKELNQAPDSYK